MNIVNADNFNETMEGYKDYAIDFMVEVLKEKGYSEDQISEVIKTMNNGFKWAKGGMTMSDARKYKRKNY